MKAYCTKCRKYENHRLVKGININGLGYPYLIKLFCNHCNNYNHTGLGSSEEDAKQHLLAQLEY